VTIKRKAGAASPATGSEERADPNITSRGGGFGDVRILAPTATATAAALALRLSTNGALLAFRKVFLRGHCDRCVDGFGPLEEHETETHAEAERALEERKRATQREREQRDRERREREEAEREGKIERYAAWPEDELAAKLGVYEDKIREVFRDVADGDEDAGRRLPGLREEIEIMREAQARAAEPEEDDWSDPVADLKPRRVLETGFETLDKSTHGGLPETKLVTILAPAESSKTTTCAVLGVRFGQQGCSVGILFSDGGRNAGLARIASAIGLDGEKAEDGDPETKAKLVAWLEEHHVIVPPDNVPVERVIERLEEEPPERPRVLIVDSIHRAKFIAAGEIGTERLILEAGIEVLKRTALDLRFIVIGTVEPNRYFVQHKSGAIGAGAGSRQFDHAPDLMLSLSVIRKGTDDEPEIIRVEIEKNKVTGRRRRFWLELDKPRAALKEVPEPKRVAATHKGGKPVDRRQRDGGEENKKKLREAMAGLLPQALEMGDPGVSRRPLARKSGMSDTQDRFKVALASLIENREWEGPLTGQRKGNFYRPRKSS